MVTRSSAVLAVAIMEDLGLHDPHESLDSADEEMIVRRWENIYAELAFDRATYFAVDAIPQEAFEAVIGIMRLTVGPAFGVPGLVGEDLNNAMDGAKRRLRKFVAKPASNTETQSDYM
jgi:hypothetical protein